MEELNPQANAEPDYKARVAELETLVAQKNEELNAANSRIAELDKKVTATSDTLSQAVASYKALAIKSNPGVEELIGGESIEEIHASVEKAKTLIVKVRQGIEDEAARIKIPAGAPQRKPIDLSALSPREKIQYAIGGKK